MFPSVCFVGISNEFWGVVVVAAAEKKKDGARTHKRRHTDRPAGKRAAKDAPDQIEESVSNVACRRPPLRVEKG